MRKISSLFCQSVVPQIKTQESLCRFRESNEKKYNILNSLSNKTQKDHLLKKLEFNIDIYIFHFPLFLWIKE